MTLYKRRDKLAKFSKKTGKSFSKLGLSGAAWTLVGVIFGVAAAFFLIMSDFLIAAALFAIAAFMDSVDGAVARHRKENSRLGAYYDTISDRYVEGMIILALVLIDLPGFVFPSFFWAALYMFGSMMVTYAKAAAKEKDLVSKEIRGGVLERPDRLILLFTGILSAYFNPLYLTYVIALLALLANITALQRISIAIGSVKK